MSKIAEKRTDEIIGEFHHGDHTDHSGHNAQWVNFKEGYDQAMQDFLEKAEKWLEPTFKDIAGYNCGGDLINDFKNYIQDESEN